MNNRIFSFKQYTPLYPIGFPMANIFSFIEYRYSRSHSTQTKGELIQQLQNILDTPREQLDKK